MACKRFRNTKNSVNSKRLKGSGLKALRVITSSPEEEDFRGFREDDIKENSVWVANQVRILAKDQQILDEWDTSLPLPAPYEEGNKNNKKIMKFFSY